MRRDTARAVTNHPLMRVRNTPTLQWRGDSAGIMSAISRTSDLQLVHRHFHDHFSAAARMKNERSNGDEERTSDFAREPRHRHATVAEAWTAPARTRASRDWRHLRR